MATELDSVSIHQLRPADRGAISKLHGSHGSILGGDGNNPKAAFVDAAQKPNQAEAETPRAIEEADATRTIELLNQAMERFNHSVEFQHDKDTDQTVILVKDHETGEVLRQIPHEETMRLMARLQELDMLQPSEVREATSSFLVNERI